MIVNVEKSLNIHNVGVQWLKTPQLELEGRRLVTSLPARYVPVVSRVILGISTLLALCLGCCGMLLSCHSGYSIKRRNRLFMSILFHLSQLLHQPVKWPISFSLDLFLLVLRTRCGERDVFHILFAIHSLNCPVVPVRATVITEIPPSHTYTVFTFTILFSHDECFVRFSTDKSIQRGKFVS